MRKSVFTTVLAAVFAVIAMTPVFAGNLDAPSAPGSTNSYTLDAIWNRLNDGTPGAQGTFTGPPSGAIGGTGHTLDDVMAKAPAVDNTNGASIADVLSGKTFWCLTGGAWGLKTGTYTCPSTATGDAVVGDVLTGKTFSNSSSNGITGTMANKGGTSFTPTTAAQTIAAGYYDGSGSVSGDADLVTGNIRSGVNIFGVSGKTEVVDTTEATSPAAAGNILSGRKAFVNGAAVTGTVTAGSNVTGTAGSLSMTIPDGLYSGAKTANSGRVVFGSENGYGK